MWPALAGFGPCAAPLDPTLRSAGQVSAHDDHRVAGAAIAQVVGIIVSTLARDRLWRA